MNPQRILFATMPMDGHFSPLTGLAMHLSQLGHDVRWYVGGHYGEKVARLGLHHYPFVKAQVVNQENLDSLFPERVTIKGMVARLRFDINQLFLLRVPEFVDDLTAIYQTWPYDLIIHDMMFLGASFVRPVLPIKTVAVGVAPLIESDENLPPMGMGKHPATTLAGKLLQQFMRYLMKQVMLRPCQVLYNQLLEAQHLPRTNEFLFDAMVRTADLFLQSGVPAFDYPRQRISPNVRFVGGLLPYSRGHRQPFAKAARALAHKRVVLVTQGTVERDVEKLIVPTLEAFKNDPDTFVIVTTGGSRTDELRTRYMYDNCLIEDFVDFNSVMPYVHVYVTNGGYGGVMLALRHQLPIVAAGVYEGKNEITARIAYCRVGVDLKTETPSSAQISRSVTQVLATPSYRQNLRQLSHELMAYQPDELVERYIDELMAGQPAVATDALV